MNHCWGAEKVPVSGWMFGRALQCAGDPYDGQRKLPQATTSWFWRPGGRFFGYNTWVLWSLICGGSAAAGVGVRTLPCPKLNFHWKIEEANMPRARRWTLSFLLLSFNRIKLLIILWTGLRPYFNLSWRAGEIRERERCFGPPQLSRARARCRLLFHYNTRLWQLIYLSNPRAHARMREIGIESNELCSLVKETNESISNVWLQYWPELMLVWSLCYWLKANIFTNVDTYREVRSILEDTSICSGPSTSMALNRWMISDPRVTVYIMLVSSLSARLYRLILTVLSAVRVGRVGCCLWYW